jgi:hypothetical protein
MDLAAEFVRLEKEHGRGAFLEAIARLHASACTLTSPDSLELPDPEEVVTLDADEESPTAEVTPYAEGTIPARYVDLGRLGEGGGARCGGSATVSWGGSPRSR